MTIAMALELADKLAGKSEYTEEEVALRALAGAYRLQKKVIAKLRTVAPEQMPACRQVKDLVHEALRIDGALHKQWYLEQILAILGETGAEEYEPGFPP